MHLNCRPNQLAMLIKDIMVYHNDEECLLLRSGFICKTVRLDFQEGVPSWEVDDKITVSVKFSCGCGSVVEVYAIADALLLPLPDLPDEEEELRINDLKEPA